MWTQYETGHSTEAYWGGPHAGRDGHDHGLRASSAEAAQQSTSKIPPFWDLPLERRCYPFVVWATDIRVWSATTTELPERAQGGAVAQRLAGVARHLAREIPPDLLRDGRGEADPNDPHQVVHVTGLEFLMRGLRRRYSQAPVETSLQEVVEILTFRRLPSESIDDAVGRFEIAQSHA